MVYKEKHLRYFVYLDFVDKSKILQLWIKLLLLNLRFKKLILRASLNESLWSWFFLYLIIYSYLNGWKEENRDLSLYSCLKIYFDAKKWNQCILMCKKKKAQNRGEIEVLFILMRGEELIVLGFALFLKVCV